MEWQTRRGLDLELVLFGESLVRPKQSLIKDMPSRGFGLLEATFRQTL